MKNKKNIIIIIVLIDIIFLGLLTFYYSNLYKGIELKYKISNEQNKNDKDEFEIEIKAPITEEQAKQIMEEYNKNIISKYVNNYKFVEIRKEKIDLQYKYIIGENLYEKRLQVPYDSRVLNIKNSELNVYAIYYDSNNGESVMTGYVDINTGEIIGIYQRGI